MKDASSTSTTAAPSPASDSVNETNTLENSGLHSPQAEVDDSGSNDESDDEQPFKRARQEESSNVYFTRSRKPKKSKRSAQSSQTSQMPEEEGSAMSRSSHEQPLTSPFYSLEPTPLLKASMDAKMLNSIKHVGSSSTLLPSGASSDRLSAISENEQTTNTSAEFAVPQAPRRLITKPFDLKHFLDRHTLTRLEPGENPFCMSSLPFPQFNNCDQLPSVKNLLKALRQGEQADELNGPLLRLQGQQQAKQHAPSPVQAPYSIRSLFAQQQSVLTAAMPPPRSVGGLSDTSEESQQQLRDRFFPSPKNDHQLHMLTQCALNSPIPWQGSDNTHAATPAFQLLPQHLTLQEQMQQTFTPMAQGSHLQSLIPIPTPGQLRATNVFNSPDFNWMQQQSSFVQPIPPNFFHFT